MKRIIILLSIALIIFACGENHKLITNNDDNPQDTTSTPSSPFEGMTFGTDNSLEIMTWNLEHFPKAGTTTLSKVADAIIHLSVDIIAFQEIEDGSSFNQLVNNVNQADSVNTWTSYRANTAYYDINLAYIYKSNIIHKNRIYEILQSDYWNLPRSPLVFDFDYNNINIIAIANHYKAMGDSQSEERRREASDLLYTYINENFAYQNVIMLGDLNDELTDEPADNVFQIFLDDPQNYKFADMDIANGSQANWSYPSWPSHLDHIMITNELFDEFTNEGSSVQTIKPDSYIGWSTYNNNISDHRPVALKLYF